jgi:hypothetical protein
MVSRRSPPASTETMRKKSGRDHEERFLREYDKVAQLDPEIPTGPSKHRNIFLSRLPLPVEPEFHPLAEDAIVATLRDQLAQRRVCEVGST